MGFAFQQLDADGLDIAPGPSGTPTFSTGVHLRGLPVKHGQLTQSPNSMDHDPTGSPPVYWPNVIVKQASIGGTAGTNTYSPTMKSGDITNGCVQHTILVQPTWAIPAGDWVVRLMAPIQPNGDKLVIAVAAGVWVRNGAVWTNSTPAIFQHTFASAIPLSQIGPTSIEETIAGSEVVIDPADDERFVTICWAVRNAIASAEAFSVYSQAIYDTPIVATAQGVGYTLGQQGGSHNYVSG